MQLVVPMAGLGARFVEAGYDIPKPLLPVSGKPMVVRAVESVPGVTRAIFLCLAEHLRDFPVQSQLEEHFPGCVIVPVEGLTEGQACTVRLAAPHLDPDRPVTVAACDNTHVYDPAAFEKLAGDDAIDGIIWTYRGDPQVLIHPQAHGWVRVESGIEVASVSPKVAISACGLADHVVSGWFTFRSAGMMIEGIDRLVASGARVNGEFYMDSVPNFLLRSGRRIVVFETDKYIGWGTPGHYRSYQLWERYFQGALDA